MADIRRIVDLYELYGSYKKVARELSISPNTAKKYLRRIKDLQDGEAEEILPKNRKIIQPSRVLKETVRLKIHQYLESNLEPSVSLGTNQIYLLISPDMFQMQRLHDKS